MNKVSFLFIYESVVFSCFHGFLYLIHTLHAVRQLNCLAAVAWLQLEDLFNLLAIINCWFFIKCCEKPWQAVVFTINAHQPFNLAHLFPQTCNSIWHFLLNFHDWLTKFVVSLVTTNSNTVSNFNLTHLHSCIHNSRPQTVSIIPIFFAHCLTLPDHLFEWLLVSFTDRTALFLDNLVEVDLVWMLNVEKCFKVV